MTASGSYRVTVQKRHLVSLPKDVRKQLHISEGDVLDMKIDGNKIIIEPYKLIPASQAYFWTERTQKELQAAAQDVREGRIREFSDIKDYLAGLDDA